MKTTLFSIALFLGACSVFGQETLTYDHNGVDRTYILYRPANLPENAPLVFALHGYTGNAPLLMACSGTNLIADTAKFAVCYPQGLNATTNQPHWNARLTISSTDDIGFLTELAGHLQINYKLNSKRTFICGHSNGGFMSYTLASERPDVFRAIGNIAGTMSGISWNTCKPTHPIPVLHVHGEADNTVPIDGSISSAGGWGGAPHVDTIVQFWSELNECASLDSVQLTTYTKAFYHRDGVNGNEVWYYKIKKHGHGWPSIVDQSGISASQVIWKFFRSYKGGVARVSVPTRIPFSVYPNPATSSISLRGEGLAHEPFVIYSIAGVPVQEGSLNKMGTIHLDDLKAGSYLVQLKNSHHRFVVIE
jgi:polyhydroxybutyrate depolymerase